MSAAFLASQSTPTMSVVAGYLRFRLCFEACLKVGGDWQLVKDLGFREMNEVMSAVTTPSALGGLGLFNPTVLYGSSTPDHLASYVGSAALSRHMSFRKDTELRVVRSTEGHTNQAQYGRAISASKSKTSSRRGRKHILTS